jgi:hypothetical protein
VLHPPPHCLASVSPPPGANWASEPEAQVGARNKVQTRAFVRTSRRTAETSMVARQRQLANVVQ